MKIPDGLAALTFDDGNKSDIENPPYRAFSKHNITSVVWSVEIADEGIVSLMNYLENNDE